MLRLVAEGYSAPEIGERLFISPKTVDTYKQRITVGTFSRWIPAAWILSRQM
mgnify:CR=1 FL=1